MDELKEALCKYGPLVVYLEATPQFQAYANGVFEGYKTDSKNLKPKNANNGHFVLVIGWNDRIPVQQAGKTVFKEAWLIKNSWGAGWGDNGFGWVAYDNNLIGYSAMWVWSAHESYLLPKEWFEIMQKHHPRIKIQPGPGR